MKQLLKELCAAPGVNGVSQVAQVVKTHLEAYVSTVHTDALGNVWGTVPAADPQAPTLLLEAHMDEIGFVVTGITDDGFLRVASCGGIDERTLAAAQVTVLCEPPITGVFCSTPPHLSGTESTLPTGEQRGIDIGLPADEAKQRVPIGTRAVFAPRFESLLGDRVSSKALDNRAGCAAVLRALELLRGKALPWNVTALFCTQEEVGTRSAGPAAFGLQPQAAIAVDVSFAFTPDANRAECGVLGSGAMLGVSPVLNASLTEQLHRQAVARAIPFQWEVMGGTTGTDADKISVARGGVPTALLSIPLRYMHTPVEVISLADVESVAGLMAAFAEEGTVPNHA